MKKEAVESLLRKLPVSVLEMYNQIGGKIMIVEGDIETDGKQVKNIDGEIIQLNQHYVYGKEGDSPTLVIQSSEDYGYNNEKILNVYYEIGKLLSKGILNKIIPSDKRFVDALNSIKNSADTEGKDLLFSNPIKEHLGEITAEFLKQDSSDVQETFAKSFAYYNEPNYRGVLETYAEPMFNYMGILDEEVIGTILEENKSLNQKTLKEKLKELKIDISKNPNKFSGDINTIKDPKVQIRIKEINELIKKPENRLKKPKIIYLYFRAQDLGYKETNNIVQVNNGKINSEKIDRKKFRMY
ncbi:anthrax toxin lethal factor-related metalloendopeptidase (plasmid) [Bacillus shihchuchen]|uniref:ATLF-like domain-containing protein n=1 Tax=Bacillus shihchuchen TaxID=3036942 RepID=A0ABT7KZ20_9BACI|nr:hypothetical protein [Bacillus shihchuchen]